MVEVTWKKRFRREKRRVVFNWEIADMLTLKLWMEPGTKEIRCREV